MDIRVFKTFLQVTETRHFGRAAENLFITQAAVSARIKQLEEFYDSHLFIRDKNNLKLTPAGEMLIAHANLMIEQMEQSKQSIALAKQQKIKFDIAATPNVWDAFLSSRLNKSIEFFQQVSLGMEISARESIQRKLADKTLDLGLLVDPIKNTDFNNELIGYFELALVSTSEDYHELVEQYVFVDWGLTFQKEHALHHKFQPALRTSTAMIALEVILTQGGFAYLPIELVAPMVESETLFVIETPLLIKRPIYLITRANNSNNTLLANYRNFLQKTQ
jgi:DNA-binding transcriptional LysR family regulator|tara:strand:- start:1412 stop:2242 length:831 start_codon:yes stop_codon:yes gene_type:complete